MDRWTPAFVITAGGRDITARLRDRLIRLQITDQAQDESDRLRLSLDDRPRDDGAVVAWPTPQTVLDVALGYRETGVVRMGAYRIDEVTHSGPPDTLEVTASAAGLARDIRARRTQAWHRTTLGGIASEIAARHGLTPRIADGLGAVPIAHADQTAESDIAFLDRLARQHDAVARPLGGLLVLAPRGEAQAVSGQALPTVPLSRGAVSRWQYTYAARREAATARGTGDTRAGGVRAVWWDREAGERRVVARGAAPFHDIKWTFHSEAQARAAVNAEINSAVRGQSELRLDLPGRTDILAEGRIALVGAEWRPDMPRIWRVLEVTHDLSASGYSLSVRAEHQPEQIAVAPDVAAAPPRLEDTL